MLGHTIAKIRQPRTWASRLDFLSTRSSLKGRSFPKTARWNNCHKRISEWCQGVCETAHDVCQGIRETAHGVCQGVRDAMLRLRPETENGAASLKLCDGTLKPHTESRRP